MLDPANPLDNTRNITDVEIKEIAVVTSITVELIREIRKIRYKEGRERQVEEPVPGKEMKAEG